MTFTFICLVVSLLVAFVFNRLTATGPRILSFSVLVDGIPLLVVTSLYCMTFLLTGRPVFCLTVAVGGTVLLWVINLIKTDLFQEPLMFMDGTLIPQIARHPRFYLPYLLPLPVSSGIVAVFAVLVLLFVFGERQSLGAHIAMAAVLSMCGLYSLLIGWSYSRSGRGFGLGILHRYPPSLDLHKDLVRYGLLGSMGLHGALARASARPGRRSGHLQALRDPTIGYCLEQRGAGGVLRSQAAHGARAGRVLFRYPPDTSQPGLGALRLL